MMEWYFLCSLITRAKIISFTEKNRLFVLKYFDRIWIFKKEFSPILFQIRILRIGFLFLRKQTFCHQRRAVPHWFFESIKDCLLFGATGAEGENTNGRGGPLLAGAHPAAPKGGKEDRQQVGCIVLPKSPDHQLESLGALRALALVILNKSRIFLSIVLIYLLMFFFFLLKHFWVWFFRRRN